ncbi:MAG: 50S ribosomal protein L29 [Alphaproteobacteria bacterium]|jgi:ribosomal protein L29|nr:50S ribosomal protein L29 [Alphaproteobacteria bacterium]MBP7729541.1 50S ribosomal protein L29 [Alphaproteobacteria bacterium]
MKWQDMKHLDDAGLKAKCIELRKELMGLRFQRVAGKVEKTHQFRVARRAIAQAKTLLNQRTKTV